MSKPEMRSGPPKPPPMREYKSFGWGETLVNEYKTVDWYTNMGELVDERYLSTKIPKGWFKRLFMTEDQKMMEKSLLKNRMLCTECLR